ncbi:C3 and PZP-like alpha-2-macroglobulin domain-containing protein 8 [Bombyx mori]|uniref:TEP1-F n=1 Tax=Bombyx mori TaxID=7091 RepID=A0A8R2AHK5_BOMMO|nr:C3 and PZP-like alpha-2-macroglobulin domain-containing protein 8 [Bombyx mori]
MIEKIKTLLLFILSVPAVTQCISVVGPQILRPFSSYSVAIAGGSRAYTLYVAVEGRRENGEQFSQGREVQIPAASARLIELEIGDPGPGRYSLVARSTSGPLFSSSAPLTYQPRSFCVFIQTDKRIYQPGDTINFRTIALDKYLLPLSGTADISILDAGGSSIREWAGLTIDRGIISEELILADEPTLGEWKIQVEVRGQKYSKNVLVADYVLPKFNMEMNIPKEVLFSDGRFNINVTAKHFNGLPVRGEVTFSAYAVFFSGLLQPVVGSPARKVADINGQVEVTYDLKTDLDLAEDAARPLVVEAILEEKDTLIKQNISSRILLLRTPYRLKVTAPEYFKPTLPYIVQIEVVDTSGHAMEINDEVTVERLWDDGAPVNITTLPLKNGLATYTLISDAAHVNSTLNLVIKYKEVTERVVNVQRNDYSGGQFLTLEMLTAATSPGGEMRARVTATEPMDIVHYVVIGRGEILLANTLELSPARRSVDIKVSVTPAMTPGCVVLAWYPRLDAATSTVLSAAVYAPLNNLLQHKVALSPLSPSGANLKPNSLTDLRVTGEPGSHVAILGEDTNAVVAGLSGTDGRGNGLDMYTIEREVESFSGLKHSVFKNEDHLPGMGIDLGGYTASDVFKNSGLVILTDGVIVQNIDDNIPSDSNVETGTRAPLAGPYAFSRLPPPPSPRYYLTVTPQPTWAATNFTIGNDGQGTKERWTPTSPGEYVVGAFAVHPTLGLGVAEPQRFTTSVPLSITAELPASLQKGETVAAVVILKTSLAVDTSVEVTFYNSDQYFEFEPLDNDVDSAKKIELFRRERVTVPARGSVSTAFLVRAVRIGDAPIIVEATGNGVSDSLFRTIHVKDGYEEEVWKWSLIDARRGVGRANISLEAAAGVRVSSVSLQTAGDMLASALHAARTPPSPAADPPQAARPLALACVLLDYLQATGQEEPGLIQEMRALASIGYQRLMAYRRADGSFASETDSEAVGDPWMTAVSLRWLSRCGKYVEASSSASAGAARWLAAAQEQDGSWTTPTSTPNDPRAQTTLPLTAHALLALQQTKGSDSLFKNNINKAVDYVARGLTASLDAYSLAVSGAALAAARHQHATLALQIMDKYTNTTGGSLYWSRGVSGSEWRNPWLRYNSLALTTAAWGLRCMLAARLLDESIPVVNYLLQYSPSDPDPDVVDALAQFAETIRSSSKLRISVNVTGSEETRQFQIGENNALIIQTQSIRGSSAATASASAVSEGRGVAVVGLRGIGVSRATAAWPRYTLDPRRDMRSTPYRLQLSICYGFVAQSNDTKSGFVLMTVQLPSGYLADINTISELTSASQVVRARVTAGGARVVGWVRATRAETCATLSAPRALPVAHQRPAWVTLTDLYDSSHRARVFYEAVPSSSCDVCSAWPSCSRACGAAASQRADPPRDPLRNPSQPDSALLLAPQLVAILATALLTILIHL